MGAEEKEVTELTARIVNMRQLLLPSAMYSINMFD